MTNNIIELGKSDNNIFQKEYPDKLINISEYIDRMQQSKSFVGALSKDEESEASLFTYEKIKSMIEETISSYDLLKTRLMDYHKSIGGIETPNVCVSRGISELYLLSPNAYDKNTITNYSSFDTIVLNNGVSAASSKVTFVIALISEKMKEENVSEVKELIKSLLFTIANTFNPNVVADLVANLMDVGVIDYIFKEEVDSLMKELYETLVMKEGIFLTTDDNYFGALNRGFKTTDLTAYKLGRFVFTKPEQLLDDKNHFNWFGTILNPPAYDKYRKDLYTHLLLSMIHSATVKIGIETVYEAMDDANRIIRKSVTDWIKTPDVSKRPTVPDVFNYINITPYLKSIYTHALWDIGDMNEYVDPVEAAKDHAEEEYTRVKADWDAKCASENKPTEEEKQNLYAKKEEKDTALAIYKARLRHKSLIAFLYEEILSNEKVVAMVFDFDLVAFILAFEPNVDNAMHDVHTCVTALYNKRDFKPLGIESVNPFYVHANEGDIISAEAKYLAHAMSGIANYNMGSRIACSFMNEPIEVANVIANVEYSSMRAKISIQKLLATYSANAVSLAGINVVTKTFEKDESFNKLISSLKDFNSTIPESRNNIVVAINDFIAHIENFDMSDYTDNSGAEYFYNFEKTLKNLRTFLIAYEDTVWGENNIFTQTKNILERLNSETAIIAARGDIEAGKRQYSLWPRINQYDHPIIDDSENNIKSKEETAHENFFDILPGDIKSGRYNTPFERLDSRYSTSKGCD